MKRGADALGSGYSLDQALLDAVSRRRSSGKEKPIVTYVCGNGEPGGGGECTLLEIWSAKAGKYVMFWPACVQRRTNHYSGPDEQTLAILGGPPAAQLDVRDARARYFDEWLTEHYQHAGEQDLVFMSLLACRHRDDSISSRQLESDVKNQVGRVRLP